MNVVNYMMIMGFLSLIGIFFLTFSLSFLDTEIEMGDCFDRYGNKIIGQQCEVEIPVDSWISNIGIFIMLIGLCFGIFGLIKLFSGGGDDL